MTRTKKEEREEGLLQEIWDLTRLLLQEAERPGPAAARTDDSLLTRTARLFMEIARHLPLRAVRLSDEERAAIQASIPPDAEEFTEQVADLVEQLPPEMNMGGEARKLRRQIDKARHAKRLHEAMQGLLQAIDLMAARAQYDLMQKMAER